ncbi:hypothetical protein TCAP_00997 [Tolypocladium capitatum]|uniref:Uncharacterized protein n=1 Tax=Tolypocladium capitatum TaxID=45235 RepID=A0A2K3QNH5_9HYPO|nr:hypothetical protein TCAP_00997 [Tolypocladium capitatum]
MALTRDPMSHSPRTMGTTDKFKYQAAPEYEGVVRPGIVLIDVCHLPEQDLESSAPFLLAVFINKYARPTNAVARLQASWMSACMSTVGSSTPLLNADISMSSTMLATQSLERVLYRAGGR